MCIFKIEESILPQKSHIKLLRSSFQKNNKQNSISNRKVVEGYNQIYIWDIF